MERGRLLAGRYELLERLGRGGMGEVWSARDQVLHRDVAVKLLLVDEALAQDLSARFEREAVAAAQVNHPNVASLYDRGMHEDMHFLVMERVDGMPLSALIKASGPLPLRRALELAEQICAALEATHRAGVIHYDIKPQNVMITVAGVAKLVDFGIAGFLQSHLSVVRSSRLSPAATLEYAAPEQFTDERGNERSDLYAVGGVLFAMLTGHAPFTGHSAWAVMAAKMSNEAPRLDQERPALPPALGDLVAELLEREPALRPHSAREVRERLLRLRIDLGEAEPGLAVTLVEEDFAQDEPPASETPESPKASPPSAADGAWAAVGPRQLPVDTGLFTGRDHELRALFTMVERARTTTAPGTVAIAAINGMGGVGKTALAVRAAHRLAGRFPDGQLFLDLYGHAPGTPPRDPADALATLLSGLGVATQQIPPDTDARAALYRERLAGTRTLILLDNAADEAQVRPLLPAAESCLVLVTSRRRLKALDDAWPLTLDLLPSEQSVALLHRAGRLGADQPDGPLVERAAALCGHLPLALVIAASLVRVGGPSWTVARLVERLGTRLESGDLTAFSDDVRSVSAVFDLSYLALSPERQALYRSLALIPGPTVDAYAAAALLDTDPQTAEDLLEALADYSLLTEHAPGRYQAHDLIRAHTRAVDAQADSEAEQAAALDRLFVYYAHTAQGSSIPIARYPRPEPEGPAPVHAPAHAHALGDVDAARIWLRGERPNLVAAYTYAHTHDLDGHAVALAAGLAEILRADGPWTDALELHQEAAEAAARGDRPAAGATALADLGIIRRLMGDVPEAADALGRALEIYRTAGHRLGQANTLIELGDALRMTGDFAAAAEDLTSALGIYREIGNIVGEADALSELGNTLRLTGNLPGAGEALTRALEIYRETGNLIGQADVLGDLGSVRQHTGDLAGAEDCLAQALEVYHEIGHRAGEANALTYLGIVRRQAGDLPGAADVLGRALEIYREIGSRFGESAALAELGSVKRLTGDLTGAAEALSEALEIYRDTGHRSGEGWALNHYAAIVADSGDRPRALDLYRQALAMNREMNKPDDEALSLEGIADHHLAEDDVQQGAALLNQALEIYRDLGMHADIERVEAAIAATRRSG